MAQQTMPTSSCKLRTNECVIYNRAGLVILQVKRQQLSKLEIWFYLKNNAYKLKKLNGCQVVDYVNSMVYEGKHNVLH